MKTALVAACVMELRLGKVRSSIGLSQRGRLGPQTSVRGNGEMRNWMQNCRSWDSLCLAAIYTRRTELGGVWDALKDPTKKLKPQPILYFHVFM